MGLPRVLFLLVATFASVLNFVLIAKHLDSTQPAERYSWRGHDYPESLPLPWTDIPEALLTVEETVHYALSDESDQQWRTHSLASYGYCRLGPDDRLFAVTMFHELHCLRVINDAFSRTYTKHLKHCFAYLRHGILCAPDLTLEAGDFVERDFTRERTGETHVCRDWTAVYDALHENWQMWNASKFSSLL